MRFIRAWMVVLGLAALLVSAQTASAQAPTPAQLEMLKSLSPADRAALMEQLGLGDGAATGPEGGAKPAAGAPAEIGRAHV